MIRIGIFGLILGSLLGLLLALIFFVLLARQTTSPNVIKPAAHPPDVTLFLSERSLGRLASEELKRPVALDFEPGGQVEVTTRVEMGGLEPVVHLGLSLEMRRTNLLSQLRWLKIGFLKISANWLPQELVELGTMPGETIARQMPPEFALTGLETTPEGINLQLNWLGQ
jgi:hypothetical protein